MVRGILIWGALSLVQGGGLGLAGEPGSLPGSSSSPVIEREFMLKAVGDLAISNIRGSIAVKGWALDKIKVRGTKRVLSKGGKSEPSPEERDRLFKSLDVQFRAANRRIDVFAAYGAGLEISERLQERTQAQAAIDLVVFAPAHLKVSVWAAEGSANVKGWANRVDVRTTTGDIVVDGVSGGGVFSQCAVCNMRIREVRGDLRAVARSGDIDVGEIDAAEIYVETAKGEVRSTDSRGRQLYVLTEGKLVGNHVSGTIEFKTQQAEVDLVDAAGFVSGRTDSGDIRARVREWTFEDRAIIESAKGNITLDLPFPFHADVDFWSVTGEMSSQFQVERARDRSVVGPEPANRLRGRVGDGGEMLRVYSERGNVAILRRK